MDLTLDVVSPRSRLAILLKDFARIDDSREPCPIKYRINEVLFLLTCATISSCDDCDDIVAWGKDHLDFLKKFGEFYHGIPCARWLRTLVSRMDPALVAQCLDSWIARCGRPSTI